MSALDDLKLRQQIHAEVTEQRKRAPLDKSIVPGGAFINKGGKGWHDSEGRDIPTPEGYDEYGNRLEEVAAVAESKAEKPAKAGK